MKLSHSKQFIHRPKLKPGYLSRQRLTTRKMKLFSNENGQAIVEYTLILLVSVSLVLALSMQIFQPLQSFLKDYMGEYTSCLLETGELPSFGGSQGGGAGAPVCQYQKFAGGLASAGQSGNQSGSSNSGKSTSRGSSSSEKNKSSEGSSGGGGGSGSSSGRASSGRSSSGSTRSADGGRASQDSKVKEIPVTNGAAGEGSFFKGSSQAYGFSSGGQGRGRKMLDLSSLSEVGKKGLLRSEAIQSRSIALSESDGPPVKKSLVRPPERKPDQVLESESTMTFGNFLRIIFICAIIIILIALMGGQIAQMMKSWEK